MRVFYRIFFLLLCVGMLPAVVAVAAAPLRMTVSPAPGEVPLVEDNIGQPCHVTKTSPKDGKCLRDSACVGESVGVRPSSCIQPGGEEVLCCFPPSTGSGSGTGSVPTCSGGGRSGSCFASCTVPADLISPATGCSSGESCCASAAVGTGGGGSGTGGSTGSVGVPNPLGFTSLESFLTTGILPWLQGIAATLALVFFIIGALIYMAGGASENNIKQGKAAMTASLIGFALALAAPTFLKEIYSIFGVSSAAAGPTLVEIALNVLKFLLSIVGIFATIMLVVSGLAYMGSAGADDKAKSAKKMATSAIIGITLALAALILIRQVTRFFL
jgi:hypothetical protein